MNSACSTARAKPVGCESVLKECDKALDSKNKVIESQNKIIDSCRKELNRADGQAEKDRQALKRPYHNPFLMGAVGATAGLLVGVPLVIGVGFVLGLLW